MKKQDSRKISTVNSNSTFVYAILSEPHFLKALVNKLADRRSDIGYSEEEAQPGWEALDTSSIEAYVSGELNLGISSDRVTRSFDSSFLFTCIKAKGGSYNLTWGNSLS